MIKIIYEDNHILAVEKPPALLTQPSGTEQDNLEDICKAWIKNRDKKPGNVFLHAVHRIDKDVSGIVLFAKTSKALSRLNESLRERCMQKYYLALVEGSPALQTDTLVHYLQHNEYSAKVVEASAPNAKKSILHYKILAHRQQYTLLEIQLETGRYHQIRAQLAKIGCPIAGDTKYGSRLSWNKPGIALCHARLTITHPVTKQSMVFSCEKTISWLQEEERVERG